MSNITIKWNKLPYGLSYDTVTIHRVKETNNENYLLQMMDLTNNKIAELGNNVANYTDTSTKDDHSAYHYAARFLKSGKEILLTNWSRRWHRNNWGLGGDSILVGDEYNGYIGQFHSNNPANSLDNLTKHHKLTENIHHKFIINGKLVIVPTEVIRVYDSNIDNILLHNSRNLYNSYLNKINSRIYGGITFDPKPITDDFIVNLMVKPHDYRDYYKEYKDLNLNFIENNLVSTLNVNVYNNTDNQFYYVRNNTNSNYRIRYVLMHNPKCYLECASVTTDTTKDVYFYNTELEAIKIHKEYSPVFCAFSLVERTNIVLPSKTA